MTAPWPPPDLASREPEAIHVPAGASLHRFYTAAHDPIFYDLSKGGRLNAPDGSYGVLYLAAEADGAFAETFLRTPGRRTIDPGLLLCKAYVVVEAVRALRFAALTGPGLARSGATAEVVHAAPPYDLPQSWSKALKNHPSRPDGIAYMARHDDQALRFALFDTDPAAIREVRRETDPDADWFWALAERYGVGRAP